ncbi:3-oxo-5a-steroid 4- dehydrogenase [Coemansia sp. RSA 552]|nr:3-oxo-5a-steroid 4- dehydrogenase [Coemansia sp. RSA 552]
MRISIEKRTSSKAGRKSLRFPLVVEVPDTATPDDLKQAIAAQIPSLGPSRQRLTVGDKKTLLEGDGALSKWDVKDGDTVHVKDLGPQIGWRTVFFIEYIGPIILHFLVYNFQDIFYGHSFEHSDVQRRVYILIMGHFIKREAETAFVHRFSHGTMPLINVFKNSFHYHMLSGLNLAYWIYSPASAHGTPLAAKLGNPLHMAILTGVFLFAEASNLSTHITLRNLRPAGTRVRRIPYGYGFDLVSCPNYLFETVAWAAVAGMTRSLAAVLFLVVATAQMYVWAVKKHANYRREFPDYPRSRRAMFPFVA